MYCLGYMTTLNVWLAFVASFFFCSSSGGRRWIAQKGATSRRRSIPRGGPQSLILTQLRPRGLRLLATCTLGARTTPSNAHEATHRTRRPLRSSFDRNCGVAPLCVRLRSPHGVGVCSSRGSSQTQERKGEFQGPCIHGLARLCSSLPGAQIQGDVHTLLRYVPLAVERPHDHGDGCYAARLRIQVLGHV